MAGEAARHRDVAGENRREAADAFAIPGVDLVRHRGRADLAFLETLGQQPGAGHESQRGRAARGGGADLVECGDSFEIEAARIHLTDGEERRAETEMAQHTALELVDFLGAAAEQRELVELRADGALQPANGIAFDEFLEPVERDQQFLAEHREPLAERGRLGRDIVRAAGDHEIAVRLGLATEREERGGDFELHRFQRTEDLELFDVFREVAAGEPEVDELALGEIGELLDARLHVVERHALAFVDRREVDLILHALVILDRFGGNRHAEIALAFHDGDPEIALEGDAAGLRPDVLHGGGRVAFRENVGNGSGSRRVVHGGWGAKCSGRRFAKQK